MKPLCYLEGRIQPLAEARLDPLDRGNIFGDALYEAVKVLDGVILHLAPHLDRLRGGLGRVEIPAAAVDSLTEICSRLVQESELTAGYLYLQISRGVLSRVHLPPPDLEPTVMVVPFEQVFDPPGGRMKRAITVPDWRWDFRDIKTTSMIATVQGKLRAGHAGVDEVLFVGPDRQLREGGSTNVFVRREDAWETHPIDGCILEGVTRSTLLELAAQEEMVVVERAPHLGEMETWHEAFLCGTTTGVQPLVEIDRRTLGDGLPGEWTTRLAQALDRLERELVAGRAVR